MVAIRALRTALFYVLFLGQTVVLAIIVGTIAVIWRRRTAVSWALAMYWRNSNVWLLRWVVGIKTLVTGAENIPETPEAVTARG